jgi:SPP1 gp7 family putative phage head morphogenesis protein
MPELSIANLPFEEAIAFFKQKVPLPTSAWDEIVNEAQDWAFTVAGLTKAEMLNDLYQAIEQSLEEGTTLEEFTRKFDETAARNGWEPPPGKEGLWGGWRMQLIYMQNLQSAYAAGRLQQMRDPDVARSRPYWLWRHRDSRNPRPAHLALDGKVFRGDSVFWQVGYPPCGYGCRCGVYALTDEDVQRRGLRVEDAPTERVTLRDRLTGEEFQVPAIGGEPIVDPGFVHAPGASLPEQRQGILGRSLERLPVGLRRLARSEIGRRVEEVDFAARSAKPNCEKGYSCGSSCIAKGKKCKNPLEGQAANYADWMALRIAAMRGSAGSIFGKLGIAIDEIEDPAVPQQQSDISCGVASAQMLLKGIGVEASHDEITGAAGSEFLAPFEVEMALKRLSTADWKEEYRFSSSKNLSKLTQSGNAFAIQFQKPHSNFRHWVVVDGYDESGNIRIRDPWGLSSAHNFVGRGTRYSVAPQDFFNYWNGRLVRLDDGSSS